MPVATQSRTPEAADGLDVTLDDVALDGPCLAAFGANDERITLMGLLIEAHAELTKVLGAELEVECGLPLSWFDVLIRLRRAPEGFLTMTRLASEVSVTSGGITRLVDRIEAAGYLERRACPGDRRSVLVSLTDAGAAKLDEAVAAHLGGLDRHLIGPLTPADRRSLERILRKLRGAGPVCGA
jgi:DNA-binding MarR family transcriptional regulator